jgi:hypothetical protein
MCRRRTARHAHRALGVPARSLSNLAAPGDIRVDKDVPFNQTAMAGR